MLGNKSKINEFVVAPLSKNAERPTAQSSFLVNVMIKPFRPFNFFGGGSYHTFIAVFAIMHLLGRGKASCSL